MFQCYYILHLETEQAINGLIHENDDENKWSTYTTVLYVTQTTENPLDLHFETLHKGRIPPHYSEIVPSIVPKYKTEIYGRK